MALSKPARCSHGATSLGAVVAGIGLSHMPFAKPLLMKIGGCPVGNDDVTGTAVPGRGVVLREHLSARL